MNNRHFEGSRRLPTIVTVVGVGAAAFSPGAQARVELVPVITPITANKTGGDTARVNPRADTPRSAYVSSSPNTRGIQKGIAGKPQSAQTGWPVQETSSVKSLIRQKKFPRNGKPTEAQSSALEHGQLLDGLSGLAEVTPEEAKPRIKEEIYFPLPVVRLERVPESLKEYVKRQRERQLAANRRLSAVNGESRDEWSKRKPKEKAEIPTRKVVSWHPETGEEVEAEVPLTLEERTLPYAKGVGMGTTTKDRQTADAKLRRHNRDGSPARIW